MKYKTKPIIVDAMKLKDYYSSIVSTLAFIYNMKIDNPLIDSDTSANEVLSNSGITITTSSGDVKVNIGDWVVRDDDGELSVCTDDMFYKKYESVQDWDLTAHIPHQQAQYARFDTTTDYERARRMTLEGRWEEPLTTQHDTQYDTVTQQDIRNVVDELFATPYIRRNTNE